MTNVVLQQATLGNNEAVAAAATSQKSKMLTPSISFDYCFCLDKMFEQIVKLYIIS